MTRSANRAGEVQLSESHMALLGRVRRRGVVAKNSAKKNSDWVRIIVNKKGDSATAEIYIYDEIGYWGTQAKKFVKDLRALEVEEIELHLNSPGGEVFDAVAIYNALLQHKAHVTVFIDGLAASAASFIAQAGDTISMARNATMMIHDASAFCWGNSADMRKTADILEMLSNNVADIYAQNAGGTVAGWRESMLDETWYSSEEALEAGLVHVITGEAEGDKATDRWDLSAFNYEGRDKAPAPRIPVYSNSVKERAVPTKKEDVQPGQATGVPTDSALPTPTQPPAQAPVEPYAFVINGVAEVRDYAKVQAHIAALEEFRSETRDANRKRFIDGLVNDGKILASARASVEALANTLSDEQWGLWTASWDTAPQLPLLARHGGEATGRSEGDEKVTARIEVLKELVAYHKASGISDEELHAKASYKELQTLLQAREA